MERNHLQSQLDQFRENNEVVLNSGDWTDTTQEQTLQEDEDKDEVRRSTRKLHEVKP